MSVQTQTQKQEQKQEREEEEQEQELKTRKTSLRVDTGVFWAIKHLALDQRKNVADLADEAFRDLLKKYGRDEEKMK
jgi:hypothetical protein